MRHLIGIFLLLAASAHAQTIKTLGYNTTNGHVVVATNVTFTNAVTFQNINVSQGTNVAVQLNYDEPSYFSYPIIFTETNALNDTREGLGLKRIVTRDEGGSGWITTIYEDTNATVPIMQIGGQAGVTIYRNLVFASNSAPLSRTNLGLTLPALTNTSNVTMMRALSGSTNSNHPFSGTVSVVGTNNTNTLTFSNGILQSIQ